VKRTYHGSCHCKAVTFEANIDLASGTGKCNCTVCWKQRMWTIGIKPEDFRLLSGEEKLADYGRSDDWGEGHNRFCAVCGIHTHGHGRIEAMGGDPYVSVHLSALDDLPVDDLVNAPLTYMDGLHDNWWNPPAETRQL
jgi:hypothetical protein